MPRPGGVKVGVAHYNLGLKLQTPLPGLQSFSQKTVPSFFVSRQGCTPVESSRYGSERAEN